jgi:carbohydrate-selective porin OprB
MAGASGLPCNSRAGAGDPGTQSPPEPRPAFGGQLAGGRWKRGEDRLALAVAINALSEPHRQYLEDGGVGFLLGDGRLNYGPEETLETYYRLQLRRYVQLGPDLQYVRNSGYNRDRGPVSIYGVRLHLEH